MKQASAPPVVRALAALGPRFHAQGWTVGTSGNFSAVLQRSPLRVAITASGRDKSALRATDIVHVDSNGRRVGRGAGLPSAEALLHLEIIRQRHAGAVLHTHSVWSTLLSDVHAARGGVGIEGYEMLKGLDGVMSHEHREWVPIIENDQDMPRLAVQVRTALDETPYAHAILLRRHGLYTWGAKLSDAVRHVEILEFLFEAAARRETFKKTGRRDDEKTRGH
jgi:methylthioribulose-1-phosphate dehydratase